MVAPIDPNKMNPSTTESSQPAVPPSDLSREKFRSAYQEDSRQSSSDSEDKPQSTDSSDRASEDTKSAKQSEGPFSVGSKEKKKTGTDAKKQVGEQSEGPFSLASKEGKKIATDAQKQTEEASSLASKDKKETDTDADDVSSMAQSIQDAILKSMGGVSTASVEGGQAPTDASRAEAAKLAMEMVDKMLINDPQFSGKTGARLTLGGDVNPNLKGVEVVINTQKTEAGTQLSIEFVVDNPDTSNYISQNLEALDTRLKEDLTSFTDIRVDIQKQGGETGGEGRSKGEYIAPEEEGQ